MLAVPYFTSGEVKNFVLSGDNWMDSKESEDQDSDSWESLSDSDADSMTAKFLDIRSPNFSPKLALRCKNLKLPVANPPKCLSLSQFMKLVPSLTKPKFSPKKKSPVKSSSTVKPLKVSHPFASAKVKSESDGPRSTPTPTSSSRISSEPALSTSIVIPTLEGPPEPFYPIPGRRFLPHQLPVLRPRKEKPNVLTLMDRAEGPLSALNAARLNGNRIKVWTRTVGGVRGYSVGNVVAFDKSWNLVLRDVDEVYLRKRSIKFPTIPSPSTSRAKVETPSGEGPTFKSKELLLASRRGRRNVNAGLRTEYLVESPDALHLCRIGIKSLSLQDKPSSWANKTEGCDAKSSKPTKSQLRKKRLVLLRRSCFDFHGNHIVAQSKKFEVVERHIPQMVLMGDNVISIETHPN